MKNLNDIKILVVGDIMLDHYICGKVDRMSPEAPVPVVHIMFEYYALGGCGNVVNNLRTIGVDVTCVAAVGNDEEGIRVCNEFGKLKISDEYLIFNDDIFTTLKSRVMAEDSQVVRVDRETIMDTYPEKFPDEEFDLILISDYAKGMINEFVMDHIKKKYKDTPIVVDPKPKNQKLYDNVFLVKPNDKEYAMMCMSSIPIYKQKIEYILRTVGRRGMELYNVKNDKLNIIPAESVDVYSVIGAGDTVISIISICIAMGMDVLLAAKIANKCASYVITKKGTVPVPLDTFLKSVKEVMSEKIEEL